MSNEGVRSSLQEKVSITLFAVMGVFTILSFVVLKEIVAPAFDELEQTQARTNLIRAERAIQNDLDNLSAITGDWALWDDAYDYVNGEYPAFEDSNLDRPTLTNLDLELLAIYDRDADMAWGAVEYEGEPTSFEALRILDRSTVTARFLTSHSDTTGQKNGLLQTGLGPMLISSWPILRSDETGPISGTLIMGQLLDGDRLASLRERTEVNLRWQPLPDGEEFLDSMLVPLNAAGEGSMRHAVSDAEILSSGLLVDVFKKPILMLEVATPRQISALGTRTVNGALVFFSIAGVVVAIVAWLLLRRIIMLPLRALTGHISRMREGGDLLRRLDDVTDDEIGELANTFDELTDELHQARKLLLDQSFKAGKADTAAEVMHNISNAMTPLINSIERLTKDLHVTDNLRVRQAVEELAGGDCPPDRAAKLLQYIESAFAHIRDVESNAVDNLDIASRQAHQVKAILAEQKKHANVAPVFENVHLDEVLDEAVLVIPETETPDVELELENGISDYAVHAHRVGLLQVLGNLILNAYESIQRSQSETGRISLAAEPETLDDCEMVRLTVSDTGCGFDDNFKKKLFQRGFSSKQGHMSGLGLHWCANALASMGGRIQAESKGPGQGAEFHVLLPAAQGG